MSSLIVLFGVTSIAVFLVCQGQKNIAPDNWCDTAETSQMASVERQCDNYNASVYNQKVNITVLYESMCPGCRKAITQILYPYVWPQFKDYVNIELVPYGNARQVQAAAGQWNISCQHGPEECQLNQIETCAIYYMKSLDAIFPYLFCIEQKLGGMDPETVMNSCFDELQVDQTMRDKIANCWDSPLGNQLEHRMGVRTESVWPVPHKWVPWLLINDVSTWHIQRSFDLKLDGLLQQMCSAYRGDNPSKNCTYGMFETKNYAFGTAIGDSKPKRDESNHESGIEVCEKQFH